MNVKLLFVGVSEHLRNRIKDLVKASTEHICTTHEEINALFAKRSELSFDLVFAGPGATGMKTTELAQVVKMCFPSNSLYYISDELTTFDRVLFKKNGFQDVFLLPMDTAELEKTVAQELVATKHKAYSAVRLVDIAPNSKLDFQISVFMPANDKFLVYSAPGDVLEGSRLERLIKHQVNSVYVPVAQLPAFYQYSAARLRDLASPGGTISETERREKLRSSVRELMSGMLSESYSQSLNSGIKTVNHVKNIVSEFILSKNPADWYLKLKEQLKEKGDPYSHTQSVSTYGALFSIATEAGNPEEVAVAGMFHDLGIALLPPLLQEKPLSKMTPEELEVYKQHTQHSIDVMRSRKLVVSEGVTKAILQHHEKWGGGGYPDGIEGKRMSLEAQLLALADQFDYLTRVESNRIPLSADQAITQMERERIADPNLIANLKGVFTKINSAA